MNKWLIALGALSLSMHSMAVKTQGKLNVSAVIRDNTCELSAASTNIVVTMGTLSSKQFFRQGAVGHDNPFKITLEKCGSLANNVSVKFDGTAATADKDLFALDNPDASSTAKNVGIAIIDSNDSRVLPGKYTTSYSGLNNKGKTLNFKARYVSTAFPVKAGKAGATLNFTMAYD